MKEAVGEKVSAEWMSIAGKRIALVGGAGFIGHNLALRLNERGAHVEVIDGLEVNNLLYYAALPRDTEPNRELYLKILNQRLDLINEAEIPLHRLDARDYDALSRTLERDRARRRSSISPPSRTPGSRTRTRSRTFDHSLRTLENALDYARVAGQALHLLLLEHGLRQLPRRPRCAEDHPLDPIGIYGALKLAGEKFVIAYSRCSTCPTRSSDRRPCTDPAA